MLATTIAESIEIDAPDGRAALDLEHRLRSVAPAVAVRGPCWFVDLSAPVDVDAVDVFVRGWLRDIGEPWTLVRIGGSEHRLTAHHATQGDFIGLTVEFPACGPDSKLANLVRLTADKRIP